jgi:hypothetical protein
VWDWNKVQITSKYIVISKRWSGNPESKHMKISSKGNVEGIKMTTRKYPPTTKVGSNGSSEVKKDITQRK